MDSPNPRLPPAPRPSSPPTAFRLVVTPQAALALGAVAPSRRAVVERKLHEVLRVASLREWVAAHDVAETFVLRLGGHTAHYTLDPSARTLTLWQLQRCRAA